MDASSSCFTNFVGLTLLFVAAGVGDTEPFDAAVVGDTEPLLLFKSMNEIN